MSDNSEHSSIYNALQNLSHYVAASNIESIQKIIASIKTTDTKAIKLLNQTQLKNEYTSQRLLHWTIRNHHNALTKRLISLKCDVNVYSLYSKTPLHLSICNNNYPITKLLLENKANIYAQTIDGNTPLHLACAEGNISILNLLFKYNVDPHVCNYSECTPLQTALYHRFVMNCNSSNVNSEAIITLLLSYPKLDIVKCINSESNQNVLHELLIHNQEKCIPFVLEHFYQTLDVNQKDNMSNTPLHVAMYKKHCHIETIQTLLHYKADPLVKNIDNKSPLSIAYQLHSINNTKNNQYSRVLNTMFTSFSFQQLCSLQHHTQDELPHALVLKAQTKVQTLTLPILKKNNPKSMLYR